MAIKESSDEFNSPVGQAPVAASSRRARSALDRVLLWNFYVVPQWYLPADRLASWDMFGRPEKLPSQVPARFEQTWWYDAAKGKVVDAGRMR